MNSRFLTIFLSIALIISFIGVSTCKASCYSLKKEGTSCCNTKSGKDCCSKAQLDKINKRSFSLNSLEIPSLLCHSAGHLSLDIASFKDLAVNVFFHYHPPFLIQDLLILHKVFRI